MKFKLKTITSTALDARFDAGERMLECLELAQLQHTGILKKLLPLAELSEIDEIVQVTPTVD